MMGNFNNVNNVNEGSRCSCPFDGHTARCIRASLQPGVRLPPAAIPDELHWVSTDESVPTDGQLVFVLCDVIPQRIQLDELESGWIWKHNARFSTHWAPIPDGWFPKES